jgi:hypothetical protein
MMMSNTEKKTCCCGGDRSSDRRTEVADTSKVIKDPVGSTAVDAAAVQSGPTKIG